MTILEGCAVVIAVGVWGQVTIGIMAMYNAYRVQEALQGAPELPDWEPPSRPPEPQDWEHPLTWPPVRSEAFLVRHFLNMEGEIQCGTPHEIDLPVTVDWNDPDGRVTCPDCLTKRPE